ncbi:hypothetical protein [Hymenobacter sp. UYCo722]|uniref:hypothetical protein n=1 Tax=Hymenobacter sp. UYCo722 TaxID=3156335 RepID=UPI0033916B43
MNRILSNLPLDKIASFRESGYAESLANYILQGLGEDWDFYLYFELSRWKGDDLQVEVSPRKKLVLCIGDESERTNYSFADQVDVIFRTYLPVNQRGKVFHLPVGPSKHFAPGEVIPVLKRKHNVFFSGNLHSGRAALYRVLAGVPLIPFALLHRLRGLFGEQFDNAFPASIIRFSNGFHNGIPLGDYAQLLGDSKIVLCPAGIENPESMRHFEAASLGCIIITTTLPDVVIYRNAPFIVLSSWRELKQTVERLLREPNRMAELHLKTLDWWRSMASPQSVANHILGHLDKM